MLKNPQTALQQTGSSSDRIVLLTNRGVAVCSSLAPCASSKSVGFYCVKVVETLFKASGQVSKLCTKSTGWLDSDLNSLVLPTAKATYFAQIYSSFTQAVLVNFNLLSLKLCPVSTRPINITNLINKEY